MSWDRGHAILSCPDAIASVLERHQAGTEVRVAPRAEAPAKPKAKSNGGGEIGNLAGQCPDCAGLLIYQEYQRGIDTHHLRDRIDATCQDIF